MFYQPENCFETEILDGSCSQRAIENLDKHFQQLQFRLKRALKNVRSVRESCKSTVKMIGEVNGTAQNN